MTEIENDPSELIGSLMDVAPGENFRFDKVQADGSLKPYKIRVQLLRLDEQHQVLREAQKYAKEQGETPQNYTDLYREAQAVALLVRALRNPNKRERADGTSYYPPLFVSEEQLRQSFLASEMAQCLNMHEIVKAKYGIVNGYSDQEFEKWVSMVSDEAMGASFLACTDSALWANLILQMAKELREAWEAAGRQLTTLPTSSGSDQESYTSATGSFTELPAASLEAGESLPTDHLLSREEAAEMAARIYGKKK